MPFEFIKMEIPDIILIKPKVFRDERGFFLETYRYSDFAAAGIKENFVQDNYSGSARGVLRGLHYQKNPNAQGKLIYCIKGKIFDAAVDIRKGSPTFRRWVSAVLTGENKNMIYIPQGFAHGFCVLSDTAEVMYKCTNEYSPDDDRGIIWNDSDINIDWPVKAPVLSEKDMMHPYLSKYENNFIF